MKIEWEEFQKLCYKEDSLMPLELSIWDLITDTDGQLEELFETSSVTLTVGGEKYVLSLQVHKE